MDRVRAERVDEVMRRFSLLVALLSGCLHSHSYVAGDGTALGRVVVYRNGVAFYERHATVVDGKLAVHVPRERVDDFLKSLTVVDPTTRKPLSVSIPRQESDGNNLTMTIETADRSRADVLLTYVTEAPAWKPSYRVVVGSGGKVMLEGWAIVDNMSGEDWKDVRVGVGASSALAFRYDLWSVKRVDRDLLQGDAQFAVAPPTGVSPYAEGAATEELANLEATAPGSQGDGDGVSFSGSTSLDNQYASVPCVDSEIKVGCNDSPRGTPSPVHHATGAIQGVVMDAKTSDKLPGVTVTVSSPGAATQNVMTDEKGFYKVTDLPPGTYSVRFFYADINLEQTGVQVGVDKTTPVFERLDTSKTGGELIRIASKMPTIDPTSTTQGITLDTSYTKNIPVPGRTFEAALGAAAGSSGPAKPADHSAELKAIAAKVGASKKDVVIEAHGVNAQEAKQRGSAMRDRLVDEGVSAAHIRIVPKVGPTEYAHTRVYAVAPGAMPATTAPPVARASDGPDTPVGESHFMSERPMTVRTGSSALVSMVSQETTGGVVYFYDPISDRGDERFAFKAVRLDNPTADTLEPGPITVYGDGRFIGEGITEPVPPHASVVVPFALDRQIVVTHTSRDDEQIAKLTTIERGVVTAEVQHRRNTRFIVTNRSDQPTKVYLRHRLQSDWKLVDAPPRSLVLGDSKLFEVDIAPHATQYVEIAEATPMTRTLELSSDAALEMMKVYIDEPAATPELRAQIEALIESHRAGAELVDKISTLRDQLVEYRTREGELHAQLVTLKAVRTGGDLMTALRAKLADTSERIQQATIAIVDTQEKLMLLRVKFQNQLGELHLTDVTKLTKR